MYTPKRAPGFRTFRQGGKKWPVGGLRSTLPGTTKVIIAQRISSVQDADIIVVLDDGKISGVGSHAELLKTNEIYREVYESQQGGGAIDG